MKTHAAVFALGVLLGFVLLVATNDLTAHESSSKGTPAAAQSGMMPAGMLAATDGGMAAQMERMLEQCTTMMEMMTIMMGMMEGDMSGMMGDGGMPGMGGRMATPPSMP